MATIGPVTRQKDGSFVGKLKTLSIDADIRIVPVGKKDKASHPDYRIICKGIDVGAEHGRRKARKAAKKKKYDPHPERVPVLM